MRTTLIHPGDVIYLGRQGENGALQVQFDVSGWAETHGNGVFALIIRRPGETTPYPITVVAVDEIVHWTVHAYDTALAGEGELQLQYYVEDELAQTEVHMTLVTESINVDEPDPYISWFEKMTILAEEAAASATAAASSAESAEDAASAASASADSAAASKESASASAASAGTSEGSASDSAQTATEKAVLAESWAVGGTDSRQGEDTDNAMYYAGQAASSAESAQSSAEYVGGKAEEIDGVVQTFTETTAPGAVASVQDEGTTQVAAVRGEGTTQIAAVRAEGTDQVAAVATAGEQAVSAVQFSVDSAAASATAAASSATQADSAKAGAVTAQGLAETAQAAAATSATQAASSATQAAGSATAAGNSATAAANSATSANSAMTAAETAQANAEASEEAASTFAQTASDQAVLAESWAVGGTGTRTDEDTDNAEYYAGQAAGSVQAAQSAAETSASYSSAAAGYATAASNSATTAGNSATAAGSFATAASNSATSAAGYAAQAGDAKNAAETAQANAEAAVQGAADEGAHQIVLIEAAGDAERASLSGYAAQAATSADNAATSATAASGSAANAAASATAASGSAAAAAGSATNAASSASQASSSASSASSRATQASDSATAAVNSATAAAGSATQAAASAARASQSATEAATFVGAPLKAATSSAMTDTSRIYVYTGSESGKTAGHWYYYSGSAWTDGGVYNAVAVQTDASMSVAGEAADAKVVGNVVDVLGIAAGVDVRMTVTVGGSITSSTGGDTTSTAYSRVEYIDVSDKYSVTIDPGVLGIYYYTYRADMTKFSSNGWFYAPTTYHFAPDVKYLRLVMRFPVGQTQRSPTTAEVLSNLKITMVNKSAISNQLMRSNFVPAKSTRYIFAKGEMWQYYWNTVKAIKEAAKRDDCWGVSVDVRVTSDGELVCFHDASVDAQTDGTGQIENMTWAQVQDLNIDKGVWNGTEWVAEAGGVTRKIPLLSEAIDACRLYGKVLLIETKEQGSSNIGNLSEENIDAIVSLLQDKGMMDSCGFIAPQTTQTYLENNYPEIFRFRLYDGSLTVTNIRTYGYDPNTVIGAYNSALTDALISYAHDVGLLVVGYTPRTNPDSDDLAMVNKRLDAIFLFREPPTV